MRPIEVSEKQRLALKAVVHGCNTNKRLVGASYMANIRSESPEMISYYEAIKIVDEMLSQPTIEAEPVVHAKWVDRYGGKYANHLYECSECKGKALYKIEVDVLGKENLVQALSAACPHCRAKMDKED